MGGISRPTADKDRPRIPTSSPPRNADTTARDGSDRSSAVVPGVAVEPLLFNFGVSSEAEAASSRRSAASWT
jgi:hypothetical protein